MTQRDQIDAARLLLQTSISDRVFPAAVAEVGIRDSVLWPETFGRLTFDPSAPSTSDDTIFDLASLTKPLATTNVMLQLLTTHAVSVEAPVASFFPEWSGDERAPATVLDLLEHASGLPARLLDPPPATRREFEHDICMTPLSYAPRTQSLYSDLGFILLGMLAENRRGRPLDRQFNAIWKKGLDAESDEAAASHA